LGPNVFEYQGPNLNLNNNHGDYIKYEEDNNKKLSENESLKTNFNK
jgi:hypothetical protein